MIYAISDLHGYPVDRLKKLLTQANFCEEDYLYILGDVIDRNGDGGVSVLIWLLEQDNVQLILGNHEAMLLSCDFLFEEITEESIGTMTQEKLDLLNNYLSNGGEVTLRALRNLPGEMVNDILDYLRDAPLYDAVTVGEKDFVLVHAGFEHFSSRRKLSDYSPDELIWTSPRLTEDYFEEIHTIIGHTPTKYYDKTYDGRVFRTRTWTCIDAGAGFGNEPVLFRLDDGAEIVLKS